jgi:two-component system OmpR family sensor kinase
MVRTENGVAGTDGDSTQRRIAELQRRNEELTAAVVARDAFLAIAAHELRNPMTPIMGQVQRLRRLVELRNCSLDDVEASLRRIEWLVDLYVKRATTLLDVSRITSGKLRLEIDKVDISELVRNLALALEPAIQYARSSLRLNVSDNLAAETDRLALEQILDNLLLNAIKFGAGKPIEVTASFDGDKLCIQVRDEGVGMSAKDQARIFEPFERAIAYGAQAGFGIGLWVVRQLVDALGGEIKVESALEKGTTFTVIVPRGMEAQR